MQAMVDATLAFARKDATREPTETVDLAVLVSEVVRSRQELGHTVEWPGAPPLPYACRPLALRRAIGNLIDNALRYAGSATVMVAGTAIVVRDDGPGIPEDRMDYVFEPFARLDESRNTATGGTGLGLAIARSIARNHGGDVRLSNRQPHGLEAILTLPPVG
jgi:signal transduction histidine kinase